MAEREREREIKAMRSISNELSKNARNPLLKPKCVIFFEFHESVKRSTNYDPS